MKKFILALTVLTLAAGRALAAPWPRRGAQRSSPRSPRPASSTMSASFKKATP